MKRTVSFALVLIILSLGLQGTECPAFAQRPAVERTPVPRPTAERPAVERVPAERASAGGDKVNINTADARQLMTLEGVNRKLAEMIVDHRKAHGPFTRPEQLRKVEGVGPGVWERNRERVVVK
jgi:competence protein ComEA